MVPPYHPLIHKIPTDVMSYYREIYGVRNFVSTSTELESTTLLLAVGLDLYFGVVRPAKSYDILGESFNYFLLVTTSASVVVMLVLSNWMLKKKVLKERWK